MILFDYVSDLVSSLTRAGQIGSSSPLSSPRMDTKWIRPMRSGSTLVSHFPVADIFVQFIDLPVSNSDSKWLLRSLLIHNQEIEEDAPAVGPLSLM